jgi:hypothetical protein|tara:strand:+ start:179 stop:469 length:291 start_codon:yes stop_codon:yes gene_type:complete
MSHLLSFPEIELVSSSAADTVACYTAPATGVACEYDYSAMAVIGIAVLFISPAASSTPFRVVETSLSKSYMSFSKGCARSLLADFTTFFLVPFDYF